MKLLISGATGLIGTSLIIALKRNGHSIVALSRSPEKARHLSSEVYQWHPQTELLPAKSLENVDGIVHLAGEHIASGRWRESHKQQIRDSRILSTRNLVSSLATAKVRPSVFVCASAIGFYGDRGDEVLTESSAPGNSFLSDVCAAWEAEADRATTLGIRTINLRIGVVLSNRGGALEQMLPLFKLGLAGRLGSGKQWFPWVHLDDVVGLIQHALFSDNLSGPMNTTAPGEVTNAEFTSVLASALHRPAFFAAPAFALKLVLGEMSELLLASHRVKPAVALATGYHFRFPNLAQALQDLISD